jgi:molybdopterin-biosynthesis enzyme MoeA-like protein
MDIGLIIIGDEILSGKRQDRHMARVMELLAARGLALSWVRYLGDDPSRITQALHDALGSGDLVFSCGGIGATPDDHTRACAAAAAGLALALHPQARDLILERMREVAVSKGDPFDPNRPDNIQRLQMGEFPVGASIVPNPYNKIPGFSLQGRCGGRLYCLPGFPVMAWPMIEAVLDSDWAHLHRVTQGPSERSLIVRGTNESLLTPLMQEIEAQHPGVKVFSLPSVDDAQWGPHIELGVKGEPAILEAAFVALRSGLQSLNASIGPELVR